jgi:predicted TIM-barrel fold metal-dependent hydrolase
MAGAWRPAGELVFGSDWPGMQWIRRNMEAIGMLPLPAEGVERILGGNAARLLRL